LARVLPRYAHLVAVEKGDASEALAELLPLMEESVWLPPVRPFVDTYYTTAIALALLALGEESHAVIEPLISALFPQYARTRDRRRFLNVFSRVVRQLDRRYPADLAEQLVREMYLQLL